MKNKNNITSDPYIKALNDVKNVIKRDDTIYGLKGPYAVDSLLNIIDEIKKSYISKQS